MPRKPTRRKSSRATAGSRKGRAERGPSRWQQAAASLEDDIIAGRLEPDRRLPHEQAMASELGISRHSLRRAVAVLVAKGLLRNVPNVGTFVTQRRIPFKIGPRTRVSEALAVTGMKRGVKLVSQHVCQPPADVARRLAVARRTPVNEVVYVVTGNATPLLLATNWAPADRFPRLGQLVEMLGGVRSAMAQMGVTSLSRRTVTITSRPAAANERELLDLRPGSMLLVMEGVCVDADGEPTHVFAYAFNAERFELVVDL